MTDSQQSFSLPSIDKAKLQLAAQAHAIPSSQSAEGAGPREASANSPLPIESHRQVAESVRTDDVGSIFNQPYSQSQDQTQEDTASLRRLVDEAPVDRRLDAGLDDYFGESVPNLEGLVPMDASTGKALEPGPFITYFSSPASEQHPGSPLEETQEDFRSNALQITRGLPSETPLAPRIGKQKHETPHGLTQMFQSSQETPDLSRRKSAYISMKESQERRDLKRQATRSDDEGSDPEFPKIKRAVSPDNKILVEQHVWDRLREKNTDSLVEIKTADSLQDISLIPASAPFQTHSQATREHSQPESLVENSQIEAKKASSSRVADKTIDFDIKSVSVEVTASDESCQQMPEFDLVSQSPMPEITSSAIADLPVNGDLQNTPVAPRVVSRAMEKSHSRVVAETPAGMHMTPTQERSAHSRIIEETPFAHDTSSPVMRAGDRRKRRKTAEVAPSSSPAPVYEDEEALSQNQEQPAKPSRLLVVPAPAMPEVQQVPDSLTQTSSDPPAQIQPAVRPPSAKHLEVLDSQTQAKGSTQAGPASPSPSPTSASLSQERVSSPLTSLDSQEFIEELHTRPVPAGDPTLGHRVLALHAETHCWLPGSVVSLLSDATSAQVLFDVSSEMQLTTLTSVRALALCIGDVVQVTHPVSLRNVDLVVTELLEGGTTTDVYGNGRFKAVRQSRKAEPQTFVLSNLCIPAGFLAAPFMARLARPFQATFISMAVAETITPSKRKMPLRLAHSPSTALLLSPTTARTQRHTGGKFFGVAFSLTLPSAKNRLRHEIAQLIIEHGGTLLEDGLSELFDAKGSTKAAISIYNEESSGEQSEDEIASIGRSYAKDQTTGSMTYGSLQFAPRFSHIRAACVVSDGASRKAKYLQALALDLPCFHYAYIQQCAASTSGALPDARPFLLAAGETTYKGSSFSLSMNPIIRSLAIDLDNPGLDSLLGRRHQPLAGQYGIVVVGSKEEAHQRQIHLFLSRAMGCARVAAVETIADAVALIQKTTEARQKRAKTDAMNAVKHDAGSRTSKRMIRPTAKAATSKPIARQVSVQQKEEESITWEWINVQEYTDEVKASLAKLKSANLRSGGAERKSKRHAPTVLPGDVSLPRILTNEDVVQSLIFGQLVPARL